MTIVNFVWVPAEAPSYIQTYNGLNFMYDLLWCLEINIGTLKFCTEGTDRSVIRLKCRSLCKFFEV